MLVLFQQLCKAIESLRKNEESFTTFFDSIMRSFRRISTNRVAQVSEAFERAGGLDLLELLQRESQNETVIQVC